MMRHWKLLIFTLAAGMLVQSSLAEAGKIVGDGIIGNGIPREAGKASGNGQQAGIH
jgi:hypothetical protein